MVLDTLFDGVCKAANLEALLIFLVLIAAKQILFCDGVKMVCTVYINMCHGVRDT